MTFLYHQVPERERISHRGCDAFSGTRLFQKGMFSQKYTTRVVSEASDRYPSEKKKSSIIKHPYYPLSRKRLHPCGNPTPFTAVGRFFFLLKFLCHHVLNKSGRNKKKQYQLTSALLIDRPNSPGRPCLLGRKGHLSRCHHCGR